MKEDYIKIILATIIKDNDILKSITLLFNNSESEINIKFLLDSLVDLDNYMHNYIYYNFKERTIYDLFMNQYTDIKLHIIYIENEINILLNNPSYIFNNYLSKFKLNNNSLFIKYCINKINENNDLKINLLKFF